MKFRHHPAGIACVILLAWVGTAVAALPQTAPIDPYGQIIGCLKTCKEKSPTPSMALEMCDRSCMPTSVPTYPAAPPNGAPNGSLYVVTLGDSIMWGQGIPEGSKFPDLVTNWLQALYGPNYYVTRAPQNFAHSGAPIQFATNRPNAAPGEVPENEASVLWQADLTATALLNAGVSPSSVVLALVDGCINDVTVASILNGANSNNDIFKWTNQQCGPPMQELLQKVAAVFPNAAVVVTGYYQVVTPKTDGAALAALLALPGAAAGGPWGGILGAVGGTIDNGLAQSNSGVFASTAQAALASAVQWANTNLVPSNAPPRFALAWPNFTADNGYAAPSTWLWKIGDFAGAEALAVTLASAGPFSSLIPFPFDSNSPDAVAYYRALWCMNNFNPLNPNPTCVDASMGHPNLLGVQAYYWAIIQQLQTTLHARFPPPHTVAGAPPSVVLRLLMGSDNLGPVISFAGLPTKLTHWVWVSVLNPNTGARIEHAPIAIGPLGLHQQASGQGESFAKLYYLCKPEVIPPLRNSLAPPPPPVKACSGTVSAAGFPPGLFSVPSDPL